jgi:pyridoxal phosphate enzyme (YggS family)
MTTISEHLQAIRCRITAAEQDAGRVPGSVTLLAVSKAQPASALWEAYQAGQRVFGESYLQEALDKMAALSALPLEWHFIGPIQSNKTRLIAENFDWVHGVDRLKVAIRLDEARPDRLPPLNVCVQVNVSGESSKSGCLPQETLALTQAVTALPRLRLRGLMTIPAPTQDIARQRQQFAKLRELYEVLQHDGLEPDTLSMGMSDDFPAAIAEGATMIRIGSAIFGRRPPAKV